MSIPHAKTPGNGAKLRKSQTLIQVARMYVAFHDSIELKHSKSEFFTFLQTIQNQLFSNVLSSNVR